MTDEQTGNETVDQSGQAGGQTEVGEPATEGGGGEQPKTEGGQLRDKLEETIERNRKLESQLRKSAFREAGFNPDEGHGKALAELYDGDPDAEQIQQFAQEYSFQPNLAGSVPTSEEANREGATQRTAQVMSSSESTEGLSLEDQVTQAEQQGEWQKAFALKGQLQKQAYE